MFWMSWYQWQVTKKLFSCYGYVWNNWCPCDQAISHFMIWQFSRVSLFRKQLRIFSIVRLSRTWKWRKIRNARRKHFLKDLCIFSIVRLFRTWKWRKIRNARRKHFLRDWKLFKTDNLANEVQTNRLFHESLFAKFFWESLRLTDQS